MLIGNDVDVDCNERASALVCVFASVLLPIDIDDTATAVQNNPMQAVGTEHAAAVFVDATLCHILLLYCIEYCIVLRAVLCCAVIVS